MKRHTLCTVPYSTHRVKDAACTMPRPLFFDLCSMAHGRQVKPMIWSACSGSITMLSRATAVIYSIVVTYVEYLSACLNNLYTGDRELHPGQPSPRDSMVNRSGWNFNKRYRYTQPCDILYREKKEKRIMKNVLYEYLYNNIRQPDIPTSGPSRPAYMRFMWTIRVKLLLSPLVRPKLYPICCKWPRWRV